MHVTEPVIGVVSLRPVVQAGIASLLRAHDRGWKVIHGRADTDVLVLDTVGAATHRGEFLLPRVAGVPCVLVAPPAEHSWVARASPEQVTVGLDCTGVALVAAVAEVVASSTARRPAPKLLRGPRLSDRELQMLELITAGYSNLEMAELTFLGINTVKTYIRTAYRKIDVTSRAQAALWGIEHGIARPDGRAN